jgi:hypothetical protein
MVYNVVFDIHAAGYKAENLYPLGLSACFALVGIWMIAKRKVLAASTQRPMSPYFPFLYFGFSIVFFTTVLITTHTAYVEALADFDAGRVKVAEGRVSRFIPMPYSGHALEHFCVDKACFSYSNYLSSPGFNQTSSHGGPIHEGLPVRVTYTGNTIVRLETGRDER